MYNRLNGNPFMTFIPIPQLCSLLMLVCFCVTMDAFKAQAQSIEQCDALIRNDTLVLQNGLTTHSYHWNNGQLIPIKFANQDGTTLVFADQREPDFQIPGGSSPSARGILAKSVKRLSPLDDPYLEVKIAYNRDELNIKRVIKIYPHSRLISHHFHLRGNTDLRWGIQTIKAGSREMIEKNTEKKLEQIRIGLVPFRDPHWKVHSLKFAEATDHNNTLVQQEEYLAFLRPLGFGGNIVLASNALEDPALVVIKESPLGPSQHGYQGIDFKLDYKALQIMGLGIIPEDIRTDQWTRGYGYALGITDKALKDQLMAIRKYQKAERKLLRHRDEMVIANTWGDRSKDSRMNEQFILSEIQAAAVMGITHLQLDDGWQQGLSRNSASKAGQKWDDWAREDWQPHKKRFPNGFETIIKEANRKEVEICLWFNPSKKDHYALWERDADILIEYFQKWGIRVFKIDGVDFSGKEAEINLRKLFDKVMAATKGKVVFNMDVTAGHRMGYHYFTEYGNVFLENRYTDWTNYYPHFTLRNLWMLSAYVPPERLQIEFLNTWRNVDRYPENDVLAPANVPFDYQIATTFMSQPLAWMELSQLPEEAFSAAALIKTYKALQHDIHKGIILPIGEEPNGFAWTGFQSVKNEKEGYLLIFREHHTEQRHMVNTWLEGGKKVRLTGLLGKASSTEVITDAEGGMGFYLPDRFSFALYSYEIIE